MTLAFWSTKRAAKVLVGGIVLLATLELGCRMFGLEWQWRLIAATLCYNVTDPPAYQVSKDPEQIYELRPQASASGRGVDADSFGPYTVHIDRFGSRGSGHPQPKGANVFRILVFGSSPLYGYGVSDDQTLPAQMEAMLNAASTSPVKFEVWNFGTAGYNYAQNARLARRMLQTCNPDLVLFQVYNIRNRRTFLPLAPGTPASALQAVFAKDPTLWLENLPAPWFVPEAIYEPILRNSVFFRSIDAYAIWAMSGAASKQGPGTADTANVATLCEQARGLEADAHSQRVPIAYFRLPFTSQEKLVYLQRLCHWSPADVLTVFEAGREPDYYKEHPPPAILQEHARHLVEQLRAAGRLPVGQASDAQVH